MGERLDVLAPIQPIWATGAQRGREGSSATALEGDCDSLEEVQKTSEGVLERGSLPLWLSSSLSA